MSRLMIKRLQTPFVTFKEPAIAKRRSEVLAQDNRLAQNVAAPLFRAGVRVAGITERTPEYSSQYVTRPYHSTTLLLQGGLKLQFDGRTHTMQPGERFCCPVNVPFNRTSTGRPGGSRPSGPSKSSSFSVRM